MRNGGEEQGEERREIEGEEWRGERVRNGGGRERARNGRG